MIFRGSRPGGVVAIILLAVFVTLISQIDASAIPAFARKYETSCTTCHVIYPKLNAYGEGFRNSGYNFIGNDEELVKQTDIPLGAEAWKHVFPHGTWPGALPREGFTTITLSRPPAAQNPVPELLELRSTCFSPESWFTGSDGEPLGLQLAGVTFYPGRQ